MTRRIEFVQCVCSHGMSQNQNLRRRSILAVVVVLPILNDPYFTVLYLDSLLLHMMYQTPT